ncbi:MAG TPA: hypothetical protein VME41_03830 [Stellaceae bacterium]|nr:hypothetical protein [Stellaceae bacterium]
MIYKSKLVLIAAIAAIGIASPVLAKSRDNGRHAYAMVPPADGGSSVHAPAFTGGGSQGYNESLLKNQ